MCLTTKDPTILVAEADIQVYKELDYKKEGNWFQRLFAKGEPYSLFERYLYDKDVAQPQVTLKPIKRYGEDVYNVFEGYHSDVKRLRDSNALFVIPAGTKYIVGYHNDNKGRANYVSETIIFKKKI